ncbi:MAG TPA: DUF3667 domain-containing protein [Ideonella sp.]|nr:DUF3667 domain-containing protein [Ideonella sp.]
MSHHSRPSTCRNCDHDLSASSEANYCPHCGQETVLHPPTLWEFVHEFITHYVALEGALWRSLRLLLLKPGQLTREYFNGRRRHYVLPLRLYLTTSFVFFLAVKLFGTGAAVPQQVVVKRAPAVQVAASGVPGSASAASAVTAASASSPAEASGAAEEAGELAAQQRCLDLPGSCGWFDTLIAKLVTRSTSDPARRAAWWPRLVGMAPYAVFLMLPVFAGLMKLIYWRRRMPYGEHFVFSLHLHSVWFLALLAADLLPAGLDDVAQLALPVYGVMSMHTVYGGRWLPTLLRAGLLSVVYGVLLVAAAAGLTLWVMLSG